MVRSGHICGEMSYQGLMRVSFGRVGFYILTALQFIYPFIGAYRFFYLINEKQLIRPVVLARCPTSGSESSNRDTWNIFIVAAMVSYNVVVGDTVTKVLIRVTGIDETNIFAHRQVVIFLATLGVTIPLCLYRNVARLAKISFLSLVCVGFILLTIFIRMDTMAATV